MGLNVDFSDVITRWEVMRLMALLDDVPRPRLGQSEAGVVAMPSTCRIIPGLIREVVCVLQLQVGTLKRGSLPCTSSPFI